MDVFLYPAGPDRYLIAKDAERPVIKMMKVFVKHSRNGAAITGDEAISNPSLTCMYFFIKRSH